VHGDEAGPKKKQVRPSFRNFMRIAATVLRF